jgi:SAM-dependent methyltransferase
MLLGRQEIEKNPERFDPETDTGKLIDAEHRARYHWAAQVAGGKRVLDAGCGLGYGIEILRAAGAAEVFGVDLSAEAVEEAQRRIEDAGEVRQGDVRNLEFDDQSFDLVVCFETIEHVEEPQSALAEFRRVLRPGGVLLLSSPNADAYPAGNEHHVREYKPGELVGLVGDHFSEVEYHQQVALLASGIQGNRGNGHNGNGTQVTPLQTRELEPGEERFGLIAASDAELPHLDRFLALAPPFEVRWWSEQLAAARAEAEEAKAEAEKAIQAAREEALATVTSIEERARRQLAEKSDELEAVKSDALDQAQQATERTEAVERESEKLLAQAQAQVRLLEERLQETSGSLLDSNQELAQVPLLKHRLAELHEEHAHLWDRFNELEQSRSWRITEPLRRFRARLRFYG